MRHLKFLHLHPMRTALVLFVLFGLTTTSWGQNISGTYSYDDGKKYAVTFVVKQEGQSIYGDVNSKAMQGLFFGGEIIKKNFALLEIRNKSTKAHIASAEFTILNENEIKLTFSKNKKKDTGLPEDIILIRKQ